MKLVFFYFFAACALIKPLFSQDQTLTKHQTQQETINPKELQSLDESQIKEKQSPDKWTAIIAFLSDYRSRGISQTFRKYAVQGELKYTHESGLYFKNWASNIDGTSHFINNTSLEWDIFLGYKHTLLNSDITYDVGLLYYYYPGGKSDLHPSTSYNTLEYFISIQYRELELKVSLTLTDYFGVNSSNPPFNWDRSKVRCPNGHSYGSPYYEMNYEYAFYPKWKASAHIGYQGINNYEYMSYIDWLVSLNREFEWFEVVLTYVQTNGKKAFYNQLDHSFSPHRVALGGPSIVIAANRSF